MGLERSLNVQKLACINPVIKMQYEQSEDLDHYVHQSIGKNMKVQ